MREDRVDGRHGDGAELGQQGDRNGQSERGLVRGARLDRKRGTERRARHDIGRGRCADTGQTHPNQLELAADYETGHWVAHDETDHRTDDDRTVDHVLTADARFQVNQRGGKCHQNTLKHSCSPSLFV